MEQPDYFTQLQDIQLFERNIRATSAQLKKTRRNFLLLGVLLITSGTFWTWKLREKLLENSSSHWSENMKLWIAWFLVGVFPLASFMLSGIFYNTVIEPGLYSQRLSNVLMQYHLGYSEQSGRLLKLEPPQIRQHLGRTIVVPGGKR